LRAWDHVHLPPIKRLGAPAPPPCSLLKLCGFEDLKTVRIGHNVWIGSGALILPALTVGVDATIGVDKRANKGHRL
jgi:acetyltransferase-like isoleucine patch superfamily enzyme